MKSVQSKLARTALGWGVRDLAKFAKVSTQTIVRLEGGEQLRGQTVQRIRLVFEEAGIEFVADDAGLLGVRLRRNLEARSVPQNDELEKLTGAQIRAGRSLIRWSSDDLAREADIGISTVRRAEAVDGVPTITAQNSNAIRTALEQAGVEFLFDKGTGIGVLLRPQSEEHR